MRIIYETTTSRIIEKQDIDYSINDLKGDIYNPDVNSDISAEVLRQEEEAFEQEVNEVGVYGYILERRCTHCNSWIAIDSCWGFVGQYDSNSRYDHYIVGELMSKITNTGVVS